NKGRVADFRNTIIIMTSNMGSELIQQHLEISDGDIDPATLENIRQQIFGLLKQRLRPEFLNRIDEIVMFRPLGKEQIRRIVDIRAGRVGGIAQHAHAPQRHLRDEARDWLADRGSEPTFGARPLKRLPQQEVTNKLAEEVPAGWVTDGEHVRIGLAPDGSG